MGEVAVGTESGVLGKPHLEVGFFISSFSSFSSFASHPATLHLGASKWSARSPSVYQFEAGRRMQNPGDHGLRHRVSLLPLIRPSMLRPAPHQHEPAFRRPSSRGTRFKLKQGTSEAPRRLPRIANLASNWGVLADRSPIRAPHHDGRARFRGTRPRGAGRGVRVKGCGRGVPSTCRRVPCQTLLLRRKRPCMCRISGTGRSL